MASFEQWWSQFCDVSQHKEIAYMAYVAGQNSQFDQPVSRWVEITSKCVTDANGQNIYLDGRNVGMHFRTASGIRFRKISGCHKCHADAFIVEAEVAR